MDYWGDIWRQELQAGAAVAVWRLPNQVEKTMLVDRTGGHLISPADLKQVGPGFIAAPFIGQPYFLHAEQLFHSTDFIGDQGIVANAANHLPSDMHTTFLGWVEKALHEIKQGTFQKVVLSRTDETLLPPDFSVLCAFDRLCSVYPNAFICALYIPALASTWLCATPETLVSQEAGMFRTISLAGTQTAIGPQGELLSAQEARWSQKEIEEQAYVSRYIIECFKKIRLREYTENGPKTVVAGNLMHLKTEYAVDTQSQALQTYPDLVTQMLGLLHPTSAVCGTPKEAAMEFILATESHDRSLYSGYLGPVHLGDAIHLFVNLRTVCLKETDEAIRATYYAGGGITEDSDPEKEWKETEMKCQTLQRVIGD